MIALEEIFQHTVATGWRPRSVAVGAELARLEASLVRGTCIAPLAVDGDTLFIDPHAAPQPGDLVAFALSRRGCEAQNSSPPAEGPAQPTWRRGDRWVKLLAEYRGFLMLLDRHGSAACATLLCCESPNDVPVLHTVRNIARGGRLLYGPDTFASALRPNAATTVAETSVTNVTIGNPTVTVISLSVGPFAPASTVVITVSGFITFQNTSSTGTVSPEFAYAIATTASTLPAGHPFDDVYSIPASTTVGQTFTYEQSFSLAAGATQTFYFNAENVSTFNNVIVAKALVLKAEAIYR